MFDEPFRGPLASAIVVEVLFVFLCAMALNTGEMLRGVICGSGGYWWGTAIILLRRGSSPTRGDLIYVRTALIPILIVCVFCSYWASIHFHLS